MSRFNLWRKIFRPFQVRMTPLHSIQLEHLVQMQVLLSQIKSTQGTSEPPRCLYVTNAL